jgi:regulator of nonsense transcripts 2
LPSSPPLPLTRAPLETVEIYEDPDPEEANGTSDAAEVSHVTQALTESIQNPTMSQVNVSITTEEFSDNDEENDPIIHSFGPFGANLLPRMASFTTGDSPYPNGSIKSSRSSHTEPLQPNQPPAASKKESTEFNVQGHIINQLAFSRLSSTPWSTILGHLPSEAGSLSINDIKQIVKGTACIGEVSREGKDAAGKPLESEYYYIPDMDEDEKRREAVVNGLRKPGLRACRKQHKVCPPNNQRSVRRRLTDSSNTSGANRNEWLNESAKLLLCREVCQLRGAGCGPIVSLLLTVLSVAYPCTCCSLQ